MLRSEHLASKVLRTSAEEELIAGDLDIIRRMSELSDLAQVGYRETSFQPLGSWSAILREFMKIYTLNVEKGVSLTGDGGHNGLLALECHGEYVGEKFGRLLVDMIARNPDFGLGFMLTSNMVPRDVQSYLIPRTRIALEQAMDENQHLELEVERLSLLPGELERVVLEHEKMIDELECQLTDQMAGYEGVLARLNQDRADFLNQAVKEAQAQVEAHTLWLENGQKELEKQLVDERAAHDAQAVAMLAEMGQLRKQVKDLEAEVDKDLW